MIQTIKTTNYKIDNVSTHKNVRILRSELLYVVILWKLWNTHKSFLGFFQCILKSFYYVCIRTLIKSIRTKQVILGFYSTKHITNSDNMIDHYNDTKNPLVMYKYYYIWKIPVYRKTTTNLTEIINHLK